MKMKLCVIVLMSAFWFGDACAEGCENYSYEVQEANISTILAKEKVLNGAINDSSDTKAAIKLVDESIVLDHQLSEILKTMNECR